MKSTNKTTSKKQVKKTFKPVYTVDITKATGCEETALCFALCKFENAVYDFTAMDINALENYAIYKSMAMTIDELTKDNHIWIIGCGSVFVTDSIDKTIVDTKVEIKYAKKPNIFKRFWNWITRKK